MKSSVSFLVVLSALSLSVISVGAEVINNLPLNAAASRTVYNSLGARPDQILSDVLRGNTRRVITRRAKGNVTCERVRFIKFLNVDEQEAADSSDFYCTIKAALDDNGSISAN